MKSVFLATTALVLLMAPAAAQQRAVKIGFISTFSGPTAVIGNDMRNSFELALDHLGRKMGGLPVEVVYEDDADEAMRERFCTKTKDASCRISTPEQLFVFARASAAKEEESSAIAVIVPSERR